MAETATERRTRAWRRDNRLRRLGYSGYSAYIASPEWREFRTAYWSADDTPRECAVCGGDEARTLHHKTYERVGAEQFEDVAPLCDSCHSLVHELERRGDLGLDFNGLVDLARAAKLRRERRIPETKAEPNLRRQEEVLVRIKPQRGRLAREHAQRIERRINQ